ncbi:MAG: hypothetical protein ACI845_004388, partial [Gammaproteobacteria bacterium]
MVISAQVFADIDNLHDDKTWRRLSHYPVTGESGRSAIISEDFFLNNQGNKDPQRELEATIQAFALPFYAASSDQHPICKYPARFHWLSEIGAVNSNIDPMSDCPAFREWVKPDKLRSASLVLVSGYLGNPASTFGHVLLKVNNSFATTHDLLDQAVNYGAIVPENENGIWYTLSGLLGGYEAAFTAKAVYQENHVYLENELRDMWEYELDLSPVQLRFLVSHLWEMIGVKFQYYFIHDNCAYRMLQIVDLINDSDLSQVARPWTIPASIFFDIKEHTELIERVDFIPSTQSDVIHRYNLLSDDEKQVFDELVSGEHGALSITDRQKSARVIDTIIRYYQYKIYDDSDNAEALKGIRNHWLLTRLQLPVTESINQKPAQPPPTQGTRTSQWRVSKVDRDYTDGFSELAFAATYHD